MFVLKQPRPQHLFSIIMKSFWINYAWNEYENEYIIFCKERNFKSKSNKSRLPL